MSNNTTSSGIKTRADGASYIPASKRADGSARKEIKVRPGYKPPEDVETYKSRNAEGWRTKASGLVPGAAPDTKENVEAKSKNAKRREAARKKREEASDQQHPPDQALQEDLQMLDLQKDSAIVGAEKGADPDSVTSEDPEQQKKIRNALKKLKAVRDLREKKSTGEKLTPDQLVKLGKEDEIVRDLRKLGYDAAELDSSHQGGV